MSFGGGIIDNTPDDYKVRLAIVPFASRALQWHNAYVKNIGLPNLPSWDLERYVMILWQN